MGRKFASLEYACCDGSSVYLGDKGRQRFEKWSEEGRESCLKQVSLAPGWAAGVASAQGWIDSCWADVLIEVLSFYFYKMKGFSSLCARLWFSERLCVVLVISVRMWVPSLQALRLCFSKVWDKWLYLILTAFTLIHWCFKIRGTILGELSI